jgi:hypothetical protein
VLNEDTKTQGRVRASFETVLILVGLVALGVLLKHSIKGDAVVRFHTMQELIQHGVLTADRYPIIGHLLSAPAFLFAHAEPLAEQYNLVLFALSLGWTYWLLRDRVDHALLRRFFLVLIVASMIPAHVTQYNSEPFTSFAVGVGLMAVVLRARGGWTAVVLGVANTPATLIALGFVVLQRIWADRRLRYVLVGVAAVVLIGGEDWLRRGSLLDAGYVDTGGYKTVMPYSHRPGFSYPFLFGLLSILLSFGKGLVFFAPGFLLPVRATLRKYGLWSVYLLWLVFLGGLVVGYAKWWAWTGGQSWGPRFFLFASLPASLALAVRLWEPSKRLAVNLFVAAAWALSAWVDICAAIYFDAGFLRVCSTNHFALESLCSYTPDYSVLWYPFVQPMQVGTRGVVYVVFVAIVFAYLSMPLLTRICCQLNELLATTIRTIRTSAWRF